MRSAVTYEVTPPVNISTRNHNFAYNSCPPDEAWQGSVGKWNEWMVRVNVVPLLHQIFQIHQALSTVSNLCLYLGYYYGIVH